MEKKITIGGFLFMIAAFAIYASSGIFSKLAASYEPLSWPYLFCVAAVISILGIYAIMWQVILKRLPLTVAFLWKSTGLIFGLSYSYFIFAEDITWNNVIGIAIILTGLTIVSKK